MPLTLILWNDLYASRLSKQAFAEEQTLDHYSRFLAKLGAADCASIRYVGYTFLSFCFQNISRPMGWHHSSGDTTEGGHLTVDFLLPDGQHMSTHHVYETDDAY
jgi:hypothetical protein